MRCLSDGSAPRRVVIVQAEARGLRADPGLERRRRSGLGHGVLTELQRGQPAQDRAEPLQLLQAPDVVVQQLEARKVWKRLGTGWRGIECAGRWVGC